MYICAVIIKFIILQIRDDFAVCIVQYQINLLADYTLLLGLRDINSTDRNLLTSDKSNDFNIVNNYK